MALVQFFFCLLIGAVFKCDASVNSNQWAGRSVIVQLFEWKYSDIADECERFLGPNDFGGVQTSPVAENLIVRLGDGSRPWYERYQVMSYILTTRSGDQAAFLDMTTRCNKVGVRVYVDVVVNHMTGGAAADSIGTAGSTADFSAPAYPAVPYTAEHFHHPECGINNYDNATEVRVCELVGLKDLNQTIPYVHQKIVEHLNTLISLGVAGFRMDAAKHMWPADLREIYNALDDLNTSHGFAPNTRPFIYQEVPYGGAVTAYEYTDFGAVTEFIGVATLSNAFTGQDPLKNLVAWGTEFRGMLPSENALVYVDNHDTQRNGHVLSYKYGASYTAATAFLLAYPYGHPRVMSSFYFDNDSQGPPDDANENIVSPIINEDGSCGGGWVCEHRWGPIHRMVGFRNVASDTDLANWWDNNNNQIAFSRGNKAFIAFNKEGSGMDVQLQTGLPAGNYCDIISGQKDGSSCTGKTVSVDSSGLAQIQLSGNNDEIVLAIHVGSQSLL